MAAKGRAFLLYLMDTTATAAPPTAAGTIVSPANLIAGAQERSFSIDNEAIDGTTAPAALTTPLWRTQLAGAKSVTIEASCRFVNDAAELSVRTAAMSEDAYVMAALVYPADTDDGPAGSAGQQGDIVVGKFLVTSLSHRASLSETFDWSISLVSTGAVTIV